MELLRHAGQGDHVGVGDDGVLSGAAVLGRVTSQVLGISIQLSVKVLEFLQSDASYNEITE